MEPAKQFPAPRFCPKCGTDTDRYGDGSCRPCRNTRGAAYRASNKDKIKASATVYREKNREACNAAIARWRAENAEREKSTKAAYRAANRENIRAYHAARYAANSERERKRIAAWHAANPERSRIYANTRRARKVGGVLPHGVTEKLFKLQRGKCACGCKQPLGADYHLDHIMPLALGGTNTADNVQLLRKLCNLKKSAKHPVDYMRSKGFLL